MENWKIIALVGGALATLLIIVWLIRKLKYHSNIKNKSTLESCFGEPLTAENFTFSEAKQWIKSRKEYLKDNCKAIILKANTKTLQNLGNQFEIEVKEDNFLVIAIMDTASSKQVDSLLIKYNKLDAELEAVLEKGDGVLVIGG